jgi:murein DD-endopeptidase MepM/ murein hydrolase activator NlpD
LSLLSYQRASAAASNFVAKNVRVGDSVVSILKKYRFDERERARVFTLAPALKKLYLQLDVFYLVKQSPEGTELRLYEPQTDIVFVLKKSTQEISAKMARAVFKTMIASVDGRIRGSLLGNIIEKTKSNWVASRFMDAYILDHNLNHGLSRGDKYSLMVEKKYDGPFFIRYGEVVKTSLQIRGRNVQKKYVKIQGNNGGVFISESDLLKNRPYYAPVNYLRVASLFQPRRRHPITRRIQPHLGVDFELPEGTAVFAPRNGVVARFGHSRAAGYYVVLSHGNEFETSYNHLRRVDSRIRRGLTIRAGEKFAEVGCSGYCTKAHLHFALRQKGRMVDPLKFLRPYPIFAEGLLHSKVAQF